MATRLFYDEDCCLEVLAGKTIVFIGYGNQGRAQALNMRDTFEGERLSPLPNIMIANNDDHYGSMAEDDGFGYIADWSKAASEADVLMLLVPDQVQPELFNNHIAPSLKTTANIIVASGFNVMYQYLKIPHSNDVSMVAPRMIGTSVRSRYLDGRGFPCFVSVEQDGTSQAWPTTLAISRAMGATKGGVIESSCREETLMDLFAEQALYPTLIAVFREGYKVLKGLGCSDEALVHEMWLSKEPAEVFEKCADDGFIRQLVHHSTVSQYGQLKTSLDMDTAQMQKDFKRVAEERILGGSFAREFLEVDKSGMGGIQGKLKELYELASKSELAAGERKVRARLGLSAT